MPGSEQGRVGVGKTRCGLQDETTLGERAGLLCECTLESFTLFRKHHQLQYSPGHGNIIVEAADGFDCLDLLAITGKSVKEVFDRVNKVGRLVIPDSLAEWLRR